MKKISLFLYLLALAVIVFNSGCKKKNNFSKGNLSFSQDTVVFDTVFTTIGSTTKQFKIYNNDKKPVTIEGIQLMGGENSPFRINVDGVPGKTFSSIVLPGNDSLFVFLEVELKVNNNTNPIVIEDSIRFRTNGVDQYIQLRVWGQDMYYHYSYLGPGTKVYDLNEGIWPNDKPHVIYGAAIVDENKSLTIQAGTKIYMHKNALLYVYKGALNINGTLNNEVTIEGDRLESDYDDISGQYYGVYLENAKPSSITYTNIKNGTSGIHLYDTHPSNLSTDYTLTLTNSKISNCENNGVFIYSGARVKADNCVISKNGAFGLLVLLKGDFNFSHCDILGYNSASQNQAVGIINFFNIDGTTNVGDINQGILKDCIIYGSLTSEIGIDLISQVSGTPIALNFDIQKCLIKKETIGTESYYVNNIWNSDPLFSDINLDDFKVSSSSPATGIGTPFINILGVPSSNIGAY